MARKYLSFVCKKNCPKKSTCPMMRTELNYEDEQTPEVFFIADAPSEDDCKGRKPEPFVGRSGMFFRTLLNSVNFKRPFALDYLCRFNPRDGDKGRTPTDTEISNCSDFLYNNIEKYEPKILVALGGTAFQFLAKSDEKISKVRGQLFDVTIRGKTYKLLPTYSPQFVARNPGLIGTLRKDLTSLGNVKPFSIPNGKCVLFKTVSEIKEYIDFLINDLTKDDFVAIDYETLNLGRCHTNRPLTVQLSHNGKTGFVIPLAHRETPFDPSELTTVYKALRKLYRKPVSFNGFVGHNIKFEQMISIQCFKTPIINKPFYCTQAGAFLLDENKLSVNKEFRDEDGIYSLEVVAREQNFHGYKNSLKQKRAYLNDYKLADVAEYGAMDAWVNWHVFQNQRVMAQSQKYEQQWLNMLEHWYSGAWRLFAHIEHNGFLVNIDQLRFLNSKESPIYGRLTAIKEEFKQMPAVKEANDILFEKDSGGKRALFSKPWLFDIDKPRSKQVLFFDVLELEPLGTGKDGAGSINKKFKEHYAATVKEVALLSELEKTKKLHDSYVKPMSARLHPKSGEEDAIDERIRGNYGITNTVTGRASCNNPNMQQLPRSDNEAKKAIKDLFCSMPGKALIQVDHKTSEVKWLALMSGDKGLIKNFQIARHHVDAYRANPSNKALLEKMKAYDFHRLTAALMFNIRPEDVTKNQRQAAKAITFGLIYGKTAPSLAVDLAIKTEEAEAMIEKFFKAYPLAQRWLMETERIAQTRGYVETPMGRRRRLKDAYLSGDDKMIHHANNQARNSPIQAVSSDVAIIGGTLFQDYITENKLVDWRIVAFVHDSVVWEVPFCDVIQSVTIAEELMTTGAQNYVKENFGYEMLLPLDLEFEIGKNLGSLKAWDFSQEHLESILRGITGVA